MIEKINQLFQLFRLLLRQVDALVEIRIQVIEFPHIVGKIRPGHVEYLPLPAIFIDRPLTAQLVILYRMARGSCGIFDGINQARTLKWLLPDVVDRFGERRACQFNDGWGDIDNVRVLVTYTSFFNAVGIKDDKRIVRSTL